MRDIRKAIGPKKLLTLATVASVSTTYSAPSLAQGRSAGFRSAETGISLPLTTMRSQCYRSQPCRCRAWCHTSAYRQILGRAQVVDAHDLDLGVVQAGPKDHAANAAKAIDANFNAHCNCLLYQVLVALHYYIPFFLILVVCVLHSFFSVSPWKLATSGHSRPCLLFFFPMDLHSSPESAPMFLLMQRISDILGPVRAGLTPRPSEIFHF